MSTINFSNDFIKKIIKIVKKNGPIITQLEIRYSIVTIMMESIKIILWL